DNNIDSMEIKDTYQGGPKITYKSTKTQSREKYENYIGRANLDFNEAELEDNKIPIYREIILNEKDIPDFSKESCDPITHADVDYPKFSLGFNHWIHASKNKTEIFNTFVGKKRVYL